MSDHSDTTPPLWTGQDMADAMGARPVRDLPERIEGISIDSRTLTPGDAFFAIKGENSDGHDYATIAAGHGASVLVVAEDRLAAMGRLTVPLLVVPDVLEALRALADASRARSKAKIVAITGSAGKTTTKDALAHVLSRQGKTHASQASYNNHWGVPLTLARMPADTQYGVFEIGMNHHDEITPLVKMVKPHVSLITLIAAAHLGHFKDLDDIAKAKSEIFAGLSKDGVALINADDERYPLLSEFATSYGVDRICGYGEAPKVDVKLVKYALLADCSTVKANVFGQEVAAKIGIPGRHVIQNMMGVLGVVKLLGADVAEAAATLETLGASPGRGEHFRRKVGNGSAIIIDESYNANPASVKAALETMANMKPARRGRRIAILGDMLEMGVHAAEQHAGLAPLVRDNAVDLIFMAGAEMRALADALGDDVKAIYHREVDDLMAALTGSLRAGDIITIKSSNGVGFSRIVKLLLDSYPALDE